MRAKKRLPSLSLLLALLDKIIDLAGTLLYF
ncbi:hypothetical protein EHW99_0648 [Erwinia amylovora]|uniref:Uncharacterized protein n=3 Tax=Erwinia amylovora TaxID=552 RepID=A0A831A1Q4_ERWAM|nr:hypothetical protein EaACW_2980 [Erwinia amylovora ACW56400]QJQ53355.1 hypothetical protein EHX00_0648 [Erwinia amylovora]CBA22739.1 hypothetical protein predicted by Glimmer/Critica [Erwinia amylovora CFBP1430]CBX81839.1 hypothetical protein predicted by Glimmer/Critica [Erwinia amylovora ATCC BAA-2158]CCO79822.1 hypothetical protein BN432_3043 [Erwinia amylovora Ea356]CCO83626.1 hypothetical protein BN433_3069 [Erwinia amylovora Ea266]CCO87384.1 hypothetical protein BN434_3014 [Erwinia a